MNNNEFTVVEHLDELRKRLFVMVFFLTIAVIGSFFLAKPLINYLQNAEPAQNITLNALQVVDPFLIYLKVVLFLAFTFTSPIISYQLWAFVSPGLQEQERRATLSYIPFAFLLFLGGVSFSYFLVFPYLMTFMTGLATELGITQIISINDYFNFIFQITIPFGIIFQLPIVLLFLTRLGLVNPQMLVKARKMAYFVLFIIAAFITPPDLISHLFTSVPLFILYEVSIAVSRVGYRKYLAAEAKQKLEEQQRMMEN